MANPRDPILIDIANTGGQSLSRSLLTLAGCWKSSSILWMHANGFPVLSGLVLRGWSEESESAVVRFSRDSHFAELLVRIEEPFQRWTRRRAGYTIPIASTEALVNDLTSEGLVTILLEPANPCADFYSLASVCDVRSGKVDVEVVGPGFDASDILRADITPHERFEIKLENKPTPDDDREFRINRTYLVDAARYQASVRKRLIKIGARLRNPSFPDEFMAPNTTAAIVEDLLRDATRYLRESGQTVLLDHEEKYEPMPKQLLEEFLIQVSRIAVAVAISDIPWQTFSLAGSFLSDERLVIWDFFPPGEYDTQTLAKLTLPTQSV